MNSVPLISVLMAVRDGEQWLGEAIDSILSQTLADFEFLIIDDGSVDRTGALIALYHDRRISLLRNDRPQGLSRSLNLGLQRARGKYVARMDSDDVSLPQRLERQVAFLEEHPDVAACGSWIGTFGAADETWRYPHGHEEIRCQLLFSAVLAHPTVMFRRESLLTSGLIYDESFPKAQDYDLWCRLADQGRLANLGEVLLRYRLHDRQASQSEMEIQNACADRVRSRQLELLGITPEASELALHGRISREDFCADETFLDATETWLVRLIAANDACRRYDATTHRAVIAERWLVACQFAARQGRQVWSRYRNSMLAQYALPSLRHYTQFFLAGVW